MAMRIFSQNFFKGISMLLYSFRYAVIIYAIVLLLLYIAGKRRKPVLGREILEFIFVLYSVTVLNITGILNCRYDFLAAPERIQYISFGIPFEGASISMVLLNVILFIPYGLLIPLLFHKSRWNVWYVMLAGAMTSFVIEFLQIFTGRGTELDDLIANTLGTVGGYGLYCIVRAVWHLLKGSREVS